MSLRLTARARDQILRLSQQAMLRPENRRQRESRRRRKKLDGLAQFAIDRRGMSDEPDAQSAQRSEFLCDQDVEAGADFWHRSASFHKGVSRAKAKSASRQYVHEMDTSCGSCAKCDVL